MALARQTAPSRCRPDPAAAYDKIKRLNLAHEWLRDRRLREMYDLTQLRRRHAAVTLEEPRRAAEPPVREGAKYRSSALISTAVVAVLTAAAFGSIVVSQGGAPGASDAARNPSQSASAEVGGFGPVPTGDTGSATSPLQSAASSAIGAAGVAAGGAGPAYDRDLPAECATPGTPLSLPATIDGFEARILFVPCGSGTTFGPLAYVHDGTGWHLRSTGKLERAIAKAAFAGSITGLENEYGVAWTREDGVSSWLALYRLENGMPTAFWSSYDEGKFWDLATYTYQQAPRRSARLGDSALSGHVDWYV